MVGFQNGPGRTSTEPKRSRLCIERKEAFRNQRVRNFSNLSRLSRFHLTRRTRTGTSDHWMEAQRRTCGCHCLSLRSFTAVRYRAHAKVEFIVTIHGELLTVHHESPASVM